jgi:hypothetical protein
MAKTRKIRHRQSNKPKAKHQQHKRRGDTLFRKAFEFCKECNADVSLMVRLKENGQIYIFNSDNRWFPSQEGLVGLLPLIFPSFLFPFIFPFIFLLFSFYFPFVSLCFPSTPPPLLFLLSFSFCSISGYTNGRKSLHYPVPLRITWQELAAAYQA